MTHAILFDCEFLTTEGAPQRHWCGPFDPDPVVVQIGAVKLALTGDFALTGTFRCFIRPTGRLGKQLSVDPFFTNLTGITAESIATEGVPLAEAINRLDAFTDGARLWSWGKDELNLMAISCYVAGVPPMIPAMRFGNACDLLLQAGMPYEDIKKTRSHQLLTYFALPHPPLRPHDAEDDAGSVALVLQHLMRRGHLTAAAFAHAGVA